MDISKIAGHVGTLRPAGREEAKRDDGFGSVLDKAVETVQAEGVQVKDAPCPVGGIVPPACRPSPSVEMQVFHQASNVLDLMEKYAEALNDPKRTLKSIEPIVDQIQKGLEGLQKEPSGQDDPFERLVNEIAVTARVEAFKFQRGDYIG